jgi:hypothetical protein
MKKTRITLAIIGIIALLMVIAEGVRGLVVNIKTDELVYIDYTEFVKDPTQYKGYMIRIDSVRIAPVGDIPGNGKDRITPVTIGGMKNIEGKEAYKFLIRFNPETTTVAKDSNNTVTGVLHSFPFHKGAILDKDPLVIDMSRTPRAWYWNILLLLVPQIFIYLLANFIYLQKRSS